MVGEIKNQTNAERQRVRAIRRLLIEKGDQQNQSLLTCDQDLIVCVFFFESCVCKYKKGTGL